MKLWAITSYFNPARYNQRRSNFRTFRSRLRAPLIAVQLAEDPAFELTPTDADIVVSLADGDVMWQKERLLNVALARLPDECDAVAWIDCDVILERPDWVEATLQALEHVPLVQPFRHRFNLGPGIMPDQLDDPSPYAMGLSLAARIEEGIPPSALGELPLLQRWQASPGFAWAARRDLIQRHGLYDGGILGGGDRAFAGAALGQLQVIAQPWHANAQQLEHFRRWAEPFFEAAKGRMASIDGSMFHLWHGDRAHRGYRTRYRDLRPFGFDPGLDIRLSPEGAWQWNTDKPEMHEYVRSYFVSRREDG